MKYIASTIVRASDIALNNNLFGGTLLRWLDEYGALFAYKYLHHTFVTYKMQKTYFLKSAKQGQCIDFYVTNIKFNKISVNFDLVAKINNCNPAKQIINTNMTFVAIDILKQKPTLLNPMLFEQDQFEKYIKQRMYSFTSTDQNVFHNVDHINEMLTQLGMYKALMLSSNNYKKMFVAICYHDAVRNIGALDNEQKSVQLFKRDWGKIFKQEQIEHIQKLILCTKTNADYSKIKQVQHGDLIHDLDMVSFIDYETMKNNDVKIKTEYSMYSPIDFYQHKLRYFEKLLTDGVFISKQYQKYNTIAKQNIKRYSQEIKQLLNQLNKEKIQ